MYIRHFPFPDDSPRFLAHSSTGRETDAYSRGYDLEDDGLERKLFRGLKLKDEEKKDLEKALRLPLSFSLRHMRLAEAALKSGELTIKDKFRLTDMMQHHIQTAAREKTLQGMPSRLLYHVAATPALHALLPEKSKTMLKALLDKDRRTVGDFKDKNVEDWSAAELTRAMSLYQFLRREKAEKPGEKDALYNELQKKLVQKGDEMHGKTRYDRDASGKYTARVASVIHEGSVRPLTPKEKLLFLELQHIFPNNTQWGSSQNFDQWNRILEAVVKDIVPDDLRNASTNPDMVLMWELIDDLWQRYPEKIRKLFLFPAGHAQAGQPDEAKMHKMRSFIRRGSAAQMLHSLKNESVLTPVQVESLVEILNEDPTGDFDVAHWNDAITLPPEEVAKEASITNEIKNLRLEKVNMQRDAVQSLFANNPQRQNYERKLTTLNTDITDVLSGTSSPTGGAAITALPGVITATALPLPDQTKIDGALTRLRDCTSRLPQSIATPRDFDIQDLFDTNGLDRTDPEVSRKLGAHLGMIELEHYIEAFRSLAAELKSAMDTHGGAVTTALQPWLDHCNLAAKKLQSHYDELKRLREEIVNAAPQIEKKTEAIKTKQKELAQVTERLNAFRYENQAINELRDAFASPHDAAKGRLADYKKGLFYRIKNHSLHAADYAVLGVYDENFQDTTHRVSGKTMRDRWSNLGIHLSDATAPAEFAEQQEHYRILGDIRNKLSQTLNTEINGKVENILRSTLSSGGTQEDIFAASYVALNDLLSTPNLTAALLGKTVDDGTNRTIRQWTEDETRLGRPVVLEDMVEGVITQQRDAIVEKVSEALGKSGSLLWGFRGRALDEKAQEQFFHGWERLHSNLSTLSNKRALEHDRSVFEGNQKASAHVAEEARKKYMDHMRGIYKPDRAQELDWYINAIRRQIRMNQYQKDGKLQALLINDIPGNTGLDTRSNHEKRVQELTAYLNSGECLPVIKDQIQKTYGRFFGSPEYDAFLSDLADRITYELLFEQHRGFYEEGGVLKDKNGKETPVPGQRDIQIAQLQTAPVQRKIEEEVKPLREQMQEITHDLDEILRGVDTSKKSYMADDERRKKLEALQERLDELIPALQISIKVLGGYAHQMREMCEDIFKNSAAKDFPKQYFDEVDKALASAQAVLKVLANPKTPWHERYAHLRGLARGLNVILTLTSFQDGLWGKEMKNQRENFEGINIGLDFLRERDFFNPEDKDHKKFFTEFDDMRRRYRMYFETYNKSLDKVRSILEADIFGGTLSSSLSDEEFQAKYGITKETAMKHITDMEKARGSYESYWALFGDSNFNNQWKQKWYGTPEEREDALQQMAAWKRLTGQIKTVDKTANSMVSWLNEYKDQQKQNSFGQKFKDFFDQNNWRMLSLSDIWKIIETVGANYEKNWQTRSNRAVADVGKTIFGNSWLGWEFGLRGEEEERKRIKEAEDRLHDQHFHVWRKVLYKSNDQDEVRAVIGMLIEKGMFFWDDPALWKTLQRLPGSGVIFNIPEDQYADWNIFYEKVRRACANVWSETVFQEWENKIGGEVKKARDTYSREFSSLNGVPNGREEVLANILKAWKRGDMENADPAKYEAFLWHSFEQGKINGPGDRRWYYLVKGVSTLNSAGTPLISRDMFTRFQDLLKNYPYLEFLDDNGSWKKDGFVVPEGTPGAEQRSWNFQDFKVWGEFMGDANGTFLANKDSYTKEQINKFFYQNVYQADLVRSRVERTSRASAGSGDHDDAWIFAVSWEQNILDGSLKLETSGANKHTPDFWRQYIASHENYMMNMYKYIQDGDRRYGETPYWVAQREKMLKNIGSRIKTYMFAIQTMAGNRGDELNQGYFTFDMQQWNYESSYSPRAIDSKADIDRLMSFMYANSNDPKASQYREVTENFFGVKVSTSPKVRQNDQSYKEKSAIINDLFSENGGGRMFQDTELVYKSLQQYYQSKNADKGSLSSNDNHDMIVSQAA